MSASVTPPKNNKEGENILLGIIQGNSKVLPCGAVDRGRPDLLVTAIKHLVRVPSKAALAQDGARLKVELVGRIIGSLVPDELQRKH